MHHFWPSFAQYSPIPTEQSSLSLLRRLTSLSIVPLLAALQVAVPSLAATLPRNSPSSSFSSEATSLLPRQESNPDPAVGGSPDDGWQSMPEVTDATAFPNWILDDSGAMLPVYQTTGLVLTEVTRAVIVLPGKPRDCWYYFNAMNNALYLTSYQNSSISRSQISPMAPCFWTEANVEAGAAPEDVLIWGMRTWISGHENTGPDGIDGCSSFEALDRLIGYYMNRTVYSNLNAIPQVAKRFSDTLIWDAVLALYNSRIVNYAWGMADDGNGDTRCEAETQGSTHYTRGQNFINMVNATFGWPANATVDWG
ncbi:hypothetical protein EV361DRAFT_874093 [Lentinula raphanica]|nr:hypothetical protein EV361DRAFT_874093 [Lentinula raphanica]